MPKVTRIRALKRDNVQYNNVRFSDVIILYKVGSTADDKNSRNGLEWIQRASDRARLHRKYVENEIHCTEKMNNTLK